MIATLLGLLLSACGSSGPASVGGLTAPPAAIDLTLAKQRANSTPADLEMVPENLGRFVGLFQGGIFALYRQQGMGVHANTAVILQPTTSAAVQAQLRRFHNPIALEQAAFRQINSQNYLRTPRQYNFGVPNLGIECAAAPPGPHIAANGICVWADKVSFGVVQQYDITDVSETAFTPAQVDHLAHTAETLREEVEH